MQVYLVIALIFAVFVSAFAVQNITPVSISFLLWHFEDISLVLVILCSAALGALCVFLLGMFKQVTQKFKIKELEGENARLRGENTDLKEDLISIKSQQANDFFPDKVREICDQQPESSETKEGSH